MSADLLLYALVAAGLIFWLKNILGAEDDDDKQDRLNRMKNDENKEASTDSLLPIKKAVKSNIVSLDALGAKGFHLPRHVRIDNKTTENALLEISENYEDFDLNHFTDGAEYAFKMIIEAFAEGDLETLENLLEPKVFEAFKAGIEGREERGEKVDTVVKAVEKIDITEALLKDNMLFMTVRFTARETCVIRDKADEIISGHPEDTTQMIDVWVFGRDMEEGGPEWYLFETRDDEVEDHKTPIPEAGEKKSSRKKTTKSKKD